MDAPSRKRFHDGLRQIGNPPSLENSTGQEQRYPSRSNMQRPHRLTGDDREDAIDKDVNRKDPANRIKSDRQPGGNLLLQGRGAGIARQR